MKKRNVLSQTINLPRKSSMTKISVYLYFNYEILNNAISREYLFTRKIINSFNLFLIEREIETKYCFRY